MKVRAIVPQKPLILAKGRLAPVRSPGERAELSFRLLKVVCVTLKAVADVETLVVMTPDPRVQACISAWGVRAMPDPRPDLNGALAEVFAALAGRSHGILVVAGDLPFVRPADIVALLGAVTVRTLVLAPSKDGMGTNAMVVPPGVPMQPAYGEGSLAAHRRTARALGLRVVEVTRPGLAFDIDRPADLAALQSGG